MTDTSTADSALSDSAETPANRAPLQAVQLPIGEPLPYALVDMHGVPLLPAQAVLPDEASRDFLFRHFIVYRAADVPADGDEPVAETPTTQLGLNDINLKIGARLRIRPPQQTGFGVVNTDVIGFAPNHAVFVTRPFGTNQDVRLMFGERLEVLYVGRRSVYDFVCTVEAVCRTPFEFLVLSPPANIRRLRARNASRMTLARPVLYRTGDADQPMLPGPCTGVAMMLDLSAVGLSIVSPKALAAAGERMRVAFQIQAQDEVFDIDVPVVVRNVRPQRRLASAESAMTHGLEFEGLDTRVRLALRCLVLEQSVTV